MVQPDPSLPKELSAFFGKWESAEWFVIVAEVDNKHATLYSWSKDEARNFPYERKWWQDIAKVNKVKDTYKLSFHAGAPGYGNIEYYFLDNVLICKYGLGQLQYTPVR
jgi:hypothetical protein